MTNNSEAAAIELPKDEWYRRLPPKTVIGALVVLTVLDLGCYLLAVRPSTRAAEDRDRRIATMAAETARARMNLETLQAQAEIIQLADSEGASLVEEIAIPRASAFSDLLTELAAASEVSGIQLRETTYAIAPLEDSEEYGVLAVDATLRGEYENLIRFLHRLDASERFFIISSLGATPRGEDDSNELQISMRFDTLVRDL